MELKNIDLSKIWYWFKDNSKLTELLLLHQKLLNKHFNYLTPDNHFDTPRFIQDVDLFLSYISVGSRSEEIKQLRIGLIGSVLFNLLTIAGLSAGYIVIILP